MLICSQIKHIASICAKGEFENRMKRLLFFVLASLIISSSLPSMASANSTTSLVSTAKSYIGVPYSYGGTTTSGFDCSGFIQYVFKKKANRCLALLGNSIIWEKLLRKALCKLVISYSSIRAAAVYHTPESISERTTSSTLPLVKGS